MLAFCSYFSKGEIDENPKNQPISRSQPINESAGPF
jgi:hypothetical protein